MREVFWSQAALDDLDSTLAYIAADNQTAALKVLDRINEAAASRWHLRKIGHATALRHRLCSAEASFRKRTHCDSPCHPQLKELAQGAMARMTGKLGLTCNCGPGEFCRVFRRLSRKSPC